MLWACLYFPALPIDRLSLQHADQAAAVILQEGPRKIITACNAAARAQGVHIGLALKNAYALSPGIQISVYCADEQQTHLTQLALWALQYSSWVTPRMPNAVLLEIQASLTLFGGIDALLGLLLSSAEAQGLSMRLGVAPTPAAAELFARVGQATPVRSMSVLAKALATVPVEYLSLDSFTQRGLRQSGIRNLQQLQAIPKASLARRFGQQCTELLYKLNGTLPDPCPAITPPDTFEQAFDLPLEAPDTQAIAFPLNRLLNALGGYLKAGDLGVKQLVIRLYHHKHPPTIVTLGFLDATANHTHLYKVATERLDNTRLPAPVMRVAIKATELTEIERNGRDLFQKNLSQPSSIEQVLERLMARLGKNHLYTAMPGDDHRPEKAWMAAMLEAKQPPSHWPARPVWLLQTPQIASEPLELTTSAERIENGWWDDTDVRRDYYIARNEAGAHFWVYRLRHDPQHTWIHGLFA